MLNKIVEWWGKVTRITYEMTNATLCVLFLRRRVVYAASAEYVIRVKNWNWEMPDSKKAPLGRFFTLVGRAGFEPATNWLKVNCSTNWANDPLRDYAALIIQDGGSCKMTRLRLALRAVANATLSFTFYYRFHLSDWWVVQDSNLRPID